MRTGGPTRHWMGKEERRRESDISQREQASKRRRGQSKPRDGTPSKVTRSTNRSGNGLHRRWTRHRFRTASPNFKHGFPAARIAQTRTNSPPSKPQKRSGRRSWVRSTKMDRPQDMMDSTCRSVFTGLSSTSLLAPFRLCNAVAALKDRYHIVNNSES